MTCLRPLPLDFIVGQEFLAFWSWWLRSAAPTSAWPRVVFNLIHVQLINVIILNGWPLIFESVEMFVLFFSVILRTLIWKWVIVLRFLNYDMIKLIEIHKLNFLLALMQNLLLQYWRVWAFPSSQWFDSLHFPPCFSLMIKPLLQWFFIILKDITIFSSKTSIDLDWLIFLLCLTWFQFKLLFDMFDSL